MLTLLKLLLLGIALYALLVLGACAMQERLIFYPRAAGPRMPPAPPGWHVEALPVRAGDGVLLEGWIVAAAAPGPRPAVIYFGGNAEEVSWMSELAPRFAPAALVLVNYRGYGRSGGTPGERELYSDAVAIYDAVIGRADVDPQRVVAHGRSLGSAVAVHLATQRTVCGVLLTSPFDSVAAIARRSLGWLPIDRVLRHRFDAAALAGGIDVPLLAIAGGRDAVVPPEHSRALYDAWRGPKRYLELPRGDHIDIVVQPGYWEAVGGFVGGCASAGPERSAPG